jgi:mono/diheme cytochrome c family protein
MKRVMQMRVGWSLTSREGAQFESNAYFTPYEFAKFNPASEGFDGISVDMTPKAVVPKVSGPPSADEGKRLYEFLGCAACHSTDGSLIGHVGPSWKGLYGNKREFADGTHCVADEAYIRESILDPSAKVVKGFEKSESGMPNYGGVVTDNQIQSLILFIKSLK